MKGLALALFLASLANLAQADDRTEWVRKVSLHLTGRLPVELDFQRARQHSGPEFATFQDSFVTGLQSSAEYKAKMKAEVFHRLGLPTQLASHYEVSRAFATTHLLDAILKGAPWHTLFTSRTAYLDPADLDHILFYQRLLGSTYTFSDAAERKNDKKDLRPYPAKTESQKQMMAGFFTTPEFFERYYTTSTNQNFKRAAAMYRLALCDEMMPVILSDASLEKQLLSMAIGDLNSTIQAPTANSF